MEPGNSKAALLAFAKTIEHLVEDNLILNDSSVLGYGTSEENWYFVDGEIVKYINGKRI